MWRRSIPLFVVAAVVLAFLVGRRAAPGSSTAIPMKPARPGRPLATFDGETLTVEELKAELDAQNPYNRQRYSTPAGKKEFLDQVIRTELLARAAAKRGYDRDPQILAEARRQMANRFVEDEFGEAAIGKRLTEEDLRRFYDRHIEDYQRPERVRASIILFATRTGGSAEEKRRLAENTLREIRTAAASEPLTFARMARERSDDAETRAVDGDMRFLSKDEMTRRWGAEVAAAAFSLGEIGRISDVVTMPRGFAILRLENVDPGISQSFEDSRATVRARAANDMRGRLYEAYVAQLEKEAGLVVDEKALDTIQVDLRAGPSAAPARVGSLPAVAVMPIPPGAPAFSGRGPSR